MKYVVYWWMTVQQMAPCPDGRMGCLVYHTKLVTEIRASGPISLDSAKALKKELTKKFKIDSIHIYKNIGYER